jgi:hypothetical protein
MRRPPLKSTTSVEDKELLVLLHLLPVVPSSSEGISAGLIRMLCVLLLFIIAPRVMDWSVWYPKNLG